MARFNQVLGCTVHEVKVVAGLVGRSVRRTVPFEPKPSHRINDAVHILRVFFLGVGVIKAQVAYAIVVSGQAKVQANAFGMPDMQIAIGLGGEAGANACRV